MSARARPRVTLRMVFVLFAELFFVVALDLKNVPAIALAKAQLAHPPTTSSAFPNAGAAGTPPAHTRLKGMLTGAPVLCVWGVILDLTCTLLS